MTHRGPFQPLPFCDSVILCNRFHTVNSEPNFNCSWRTSIPDTIAGTNVQGKIFQNGTNFPGHSARPYLYMYPLTNLKYCISLIFSPWQNENFHVLQKSLLVLQSRKVSIYKFGVTTYGSTACFGIWSNKSLVQQHLSPWEYLPCCIRGLHLSVAKLASH